MTDGENSLERLFHEVQSQPAAERHEYAKRHCPDPGQREKLFLLLDASSFMTSRDQFQPGQRVGSYLIVRELGQGGMGTVYLAEQPLLERRVALKMVRSDRRTGMVQDRFLLEQQALAQLTHPNIATIYEASLTDDRQPFFAMEYVDGVPIDVYCNQHRLTIEERLNLFRDLCAAVHYVHINTVIHRDIKPGNILVTASGQVKLLDFGLAKSIMPAEPGETISGRWFTPSFASPEQIRGTKLTLQSDGFSLGVVLYSLLADVLPFAGDTPGQIEEAVLAQDPVRPSIQVLAKGEEDRSRCDAAATARRLSSEQLSRRLRGDLDNITLKAIEKDAEKRYPSADQLSEDIQRFLTDMPVVARSATWRYRTGKFLRRYRWGVLVAVSLLAVLIGASVLVAWQARLARIERARADRRFDDVRRLANSFIFEFDKAIQDVPGTTAAQQLVVLRAREYLDSLARESSDPQLMQELATAYQRVGDVEGDPYAQSLGEPERALESYQRARDIRARLPVTVDSQFELAESHLKIADVLWVQQDWKAAAQNYDIARQLDEKALAIAPSRVDIRKQLSIVYTGQGDTAVEVDDLEGARNFHQRSLEIRNVLAASGGAGEQRSLAVGFLKLGDVASATGNIEGAATQFQAALRIFRDLAAKDPHNEQYRSNMIATLNRLGLAQRKNRQVKEAIANQELALTLATAAYREDKSDATAKRDLASTESLLGDVLLDDGRKDEALTHLRNQLRLQKELLATDATNQQTRRDVWIATYQLGKTLLVAGKVREARGVLDDSLRLALDLANRSREDPRPNDDLVDARIALSDTMRASSDWKQALDQINLALPPAQELAKNFPSNIAYLTRLAFLYSEYAKTYEVASLRLPAESQAYRHLEQAAWRQCLDLSSSLNKRGLLGPYDQPMLAEARRKAR